MIWVLTGYMQRVLLLMLMAKVGGKINSRRDPLPSSGLAQEQFLTLSVSKDITD